VRPQYSPALPAPRPPRPEGLCKARAFPAAAAALGCVPSEARGNSISQFIGVPLSLGRAGKRDRENSPRSCAYPQWICICGGSRRSSILIFRDSDFPGEKKRRKIGREAESEPGADRPASESSSRGFDSRGKVWFCRGENRRRTSVPSLDGGKRETEAASKVARRIHHRPVLPPLAAAKRDN